MFMGLRVAEIGRSSGGDADTNKPYIPVLSGLFKVTIAILVVRVDESVHFCGGGNMHQDVPSQELRAKYFSFDDHHVIMSHALCTVSRDVPIDKIGIKLRLHARLSWLKVGGLAVVQITNAIFLLILRPPWQKI